MNILELEIGQVGVGPDGTEFRVIADTVERRPGLGMMPVRIAKDQHGKIHKFLRGIEVELPSSPKQEKGAPV